MMRSPLIQALIDTQQYSVVTKDNIEIFLTEHENVVLFFTENPKNFPESNDVAVILPELLKPFSDRLTPAVVDAELERELHQRYAFDKWPALVFLRGGEYLGVITGMRDWSEFQREFDRVLAATPGKAPAFTIPVVVEAGSSC